MPQTFFLFLSYQGCISGAQSSYNEPGLPKNGISQQVVIDPTGQRGGHGPTTKYDAQEKNLCQVTSVEYAFYKAEEILAILVWNKMWCFCFIKEMEYKYQDLISVEVQNKLLLKEKFSKV